MLLSIFNVTLSVLPFILGLLIGWISRSRDDNNNEWHTTLRKPEYMPPPITFSVVWPILYALLGASAFLAAKGKNTSVFLMVHGVLYVNLAFNLSYPLIMFQERLLMLATTVTWMTLLTALLLVATYSHLRQWTSSWLLAPYVLWLTFAAVLSSDVYLMNKEKEPPR